MEKSCLRADPLPIEELIDRIRKFLGKRGKTTKFRLIVRNIDEANHTVLLETSGASFVIGAKGEKIRKLEIDSGWRIRIDPWFMDQEKMIQKISEIPGFVRIVGMRDKNIRNGRPVKCVIGEFQQNPSMSDRFRFELETGWDLEFQGNQISKSCKTTKLPFVEAKKILMMNYPEIKGIVSLGGVLLIYTTNVNRRERQKFRTVSGWGVVLEDAKDMPQTLSKKQTVELEPRR